MGILSTIATFVGGVLVGNYIKPFIRDLLSGRGVVQAVREPEEARYRRKIVKTGKSKEGNRNLFALTFEPNEIDRFGILKRAIEKEFELDLSSADLGYDDFTETDRPPFVWEEIRTGKE